MRVVQNVPWIISLGTENFNRRSRLDPTWLIVENELLNLRFSTSPLAKYEVGGMAVALFNIYSSLLDHIMWEIWVYRSFFISPYTLYLASYLERTVMCKTISEWDMVSQWMERYFRYPGNIIGSVENYKMNHISRHRKTSTGDSHPARSGSGSVSWSLRNICEILRDIARLLWQQVRGEIIGAPSPLRWCDRQ